MLDQGQSLMECGHCRALYLSPDPSPAELQRFYREEYRKLYPFEVHPAPDDRFLFAIRGREIGWRRAKAIAPSLPPGARLLEIGSGFGSFLGQIAHLRPDLQLSAIEPDLQNRALALDSGHTVTFLEWDALADQPPFDAIVLFHTLEHLLDPVGVLRQLGARLVPSGRIYAEVPDTPPDALQRHHVHPAHVTCFTAATLHRCLTFAGLVPIVATAGTAVLPDSLWIEGMTAAPGPLQAPCPPDAPPARRQTLRKGWRAAVRALIPPSFLGPLSRWRHRPGLDDSLATPDGRRYRWGIGFDDFDLPSLLARVEQAVEQREPFRIADINVAKLIGLQDDPRFRMAVQSADAIVPDGMGIRWGGALSGFPIRERIAGIDLMGHILSLSARKGWKVYILGAQNTVLEHSITVLRQRYPTLSVAGWHHGYFSADQDDSMAETLSASGADCLVVALPYPRQDLFLERIHHRSGIPVAFGVGGSLDVLCGQRRRAPLWVQKAGGEWLFRLLQEPRRLGPRYLVSNTRFLLLLLSDIASRALRRKTLSS